MPGCVPNSWTKTVGAKATNTSHWIGYIALQICTRLTTDVTNA